MTFPQKLFIVSVKLFSLLPWRMLYWISDFDCVGIILYCRVSQKSGL